MSELTVCLLEYETNPTESGDYLNFNVSVASDGFHGETDIWVSKDDVVAFVAELKAFNSALEGEVSLKSGWGDTALLEILISPFGNLGHARIEVIVRRPVSEDRMNESRVSLKVEPMMLTNLSNYLQRIVRTREPAVITVEGD